MGKEQDDATVTTSSSSSCKTKESLPRAQSNLEILSQTAAVVIEEGLCSAQTSPYPARVTPADTTSLLYSSVDAHPNSHCRKSFLSLPEMIGTTQHHHQPTIFLEQKRGFLPPAVQFELGSGGGVLAAGGSHESGVTEASSYYYSPGLFLSYSYGSTGTFGRGGAEPQPPEGSATGATATVSNNGGSSSEGSHNSNDSSVGGGANNHSAGDAATAAVHSFLDSAGSFSSGGGVSASSAASSSFHHLTGGGGGASLAASMQAAAAFVPPRPPLFQQQRVMALGGGASPSLFGEPPGIEFTDEAVRENFLLRQQLAARDATIDALQKQVEDLQQDIRELRQLPTGKISQIPLEDMLSIMREFGSEVSETAMPPRKSCVQKASVVRQFRRWNPNFLDWFEHVNGKWVPKLGKAGELKRRMEARREAAAQRKKKSSTYKEDGDEQSMDKISKTAGI